MLQNRAVPLAMLGGVLIALFATGCVRSVNPILNDDQVIVNNAVVGKWVSPNGTESVAIKDAGPDKLYKLHYTESDGKTADLVGRLGKVGDLTIAEFHIADPAPGASDIYKLHLLPLYSFVVVDHIGRQLVFSNVGGSDDWAKKHLADNQKEIQVIEGSIVTSKTDEIQAFLLRHIKDDGFLGEKQSWVRPGDPGTRPADAAGK